MAGEGTVDPRAKRLLGDIGLKAEGYPLIYAAAPILTACMAGYGLARAISGEGVAAAARSAIAEVLPHLSTGGQNAVYAGVVATGFALAVTVARKPLERLTAMVGRLMGQDQGPPVAIHNERGYFVRAEDEADLRAVDREEFVRFRKAALSGRGVLAQIDVAEDGTIMHREYRGGVLNDWMQADRVVPAVRKIRPDGSFEFSWVRGGELLARESGVADEMPGDIYARSRVYANPEEAASAGPPRR